MPRMSSTAGLGQSASARTVQPSLSLRPFRALRYAPDRVGNVAAVTCPPYDVIGEGGIARWEQEHPANVVRLVLPRDGSDPAARYTAAAHRLAAWIRDGILVRDAQASLFVYEQMVDGESYVGLMGTVDLVDPADRVILPHEDVFPGPVADRLALMAATSANLEPILLVYDGDGPASDVVDRATLQPAELDVTAADGTRHRLWRLPAELAQTVAGDLAGRQALIADGHHRYASYRTFQARRHAAGDGAGPWDRGLALLVDGTRHPLRLRGIHRVVRGLPLHRLLAAAQGAFRVREAASAADAADLVAGSDSEAAAFAASDGTRHAVLDRPSTPLVDAYVDRTRPAAWRRLDATVLHELLLGGLLGIPAEDERVRYVHDEADALADAVGHAGTAVLMRPPALSDVLEVAALGERMPRKSTSFGPKPRNGLLLRLLDE